MNEIIKALEAEYERAKENYIENGRGDYEAGIVEGLKRALVVASEAA